MRIGVLMRPSRFEDLVESGLFKPETPISSRTNVSGRERFEFFLINPSEPSEDMYDVVLHKVTLLCHSPLQVASLATSL